MSADKSEEDYKKLRKKKEELIKKYEDYLIEYEYSKLQQKALEDKFRKEEL